MNPEFEESYTAYLVRDKQRRSIFVREDITAVDASKAQANFVIIVALIFVLMTIVVALCYVMPLQNWSAIA